MMQKTFGTDIGMETVVPVMPDMTVCAECGELADCVEIDGKSYCVVCTVKCKCCNCVLIAEDAKTSDSGDYYCESCYDDSFYFCKECGSEVLAEDVKTSASGEHYCEDCYNDKFTCCEGCNCEVRTNSLYCNENGNSYCSDCYHDRYTCCDNCGCELYRSDACSNDNGTCCESCFDSHCDESAGEWGPRPFNTTNITVEKIRSTRKFGVELETSSCPDCNEIAGDTVFGCKEDGSISGKEFVSPILAGDSGLDECTKFTRLANSHGFKVDAACGFHAHFDVSRLSTEQLKSVAYAYYRTYNVWAAFVKDSRRSNHYCRATSWGKTELSNITDQASWNDFIGYMDRYAWLNLAAYRRHKTFEVRLHTATLDGRKVCNWIKAHIRFIDWAKDKTFAEIDEKFVDNRPSVQRKFLALSAIWADSELSEFYAQRAAKFGTTVIRNPVSAAATAAIAATMDDN